ncbi:MAG: hypothetical protein ACE5HB_03725 [Terriglobia bacterium]
MMRACAGAPAFGRLQPEPNHTARLQRAASFVRTNSAAPAGHLVQPASLFKLTNDGVIRAQ